MYDWVPIVLMVFKVLVLGVGMFFSIKWHHDQAKNDAQEKKDEEATKRQNEASGP